MLHTAPDHHLREDDSFAVVWHTYVDSRKRPNTLPHKQAAKNYTFAGGSFVWVSILDRDLFSGNISNDLGSTIVLASSVAIDRVYYGIWTFPPIRFLYFNIAQSLAVFYGKNRWDYYLTEGFPLLLTTCLPFAIVGFYRALTSSRPLSPYYSPASLSVLKPIMNQLATTCLFVPFFLSLISHKEVRFIYPLLPCLHVLTAGPFASFFEDVLPFTHVSRFSVRYESVKRSLLAMILGLNVLIALLTTTSHQPGPISVLAYLRHQHIQLYLPQPPEASEVLIAQNSPSTMTVGFLMPCHSTPWRSHLIFPTIRAWALTCEPPVGLVSTERDHYVDEADQFYADPKGWMNSTLGPPPKRRRHFHPYFSSWTWVLGNGWLYNRAPPSASDPGLTAPVSLGVEDPSTVSTLAKTAETPFDGHVGAKFWPEYLVFFAQLEPTMRQIGKDSAYKECWRTFNSWAHDDWRRKGDVVVWCLQDSGLNIDHR